MAEREAHLQVSIEASGALASAKKIKDALDAVAASAKSVSDAMDKIKSARVPPLSGPRSGSGGGAAGGGGTSGTSPTAAQPPIKPTVDTGPATQQIRKLKDEIKGLNAEMTRVSPPKITLSGVSREIRSVDRELQKLAGKDLSRMADGGAEAIRKVQDRVASLNQQMAQVSKPISVPRRSLDASDARPTASSAIPSRQANTQLRQLRAEADALASSIKQVHLPKLSTSSLSREVQALESSLVRLSKTDLAKMADGGAAALQRASERADALKRNLQEFTERSAKAQQATSTLQTVRSDFRATKGSLDVVQSPQFDTKGARAEITAIGKELDRLSKTNLSSLADGGIRSVKELQDRLARATLEVARLNSAQQSLENSAGRSASAVGQLKTSITDISAKVASLKAPNFGTADIERQIKSVSRELDALNSKKLTGMGDGGAEAVKKVADQVQALKRSLDDLSSRKVGVDASQSKIEALRGQAKGLDSPVAHLRSPLMDTSGLRTELRDVHAELNKLAKADLSRMTDSGEQSVRRLEARLESLNAEVKASAVRLQGLRTDRENSKLAVGPNSPQFVGPMPETRKQVATRLEFDKKALYDADAAIEKFMKKASTKINLNLDASGAQKQLEGLATAFSRVGQSANLVNAALAVTGFAVVGRDIAQAGMAFENLQKGLETATGSSAQAGVEMARLREESNRLGIDLLHTGKEYVNFVAAIQGSNVNIEKAKDAFFATAQAMALLGRSPESASRAFKALEQFASKGQIMSEELKGQLAEQLPGAFNITAKALGMSAVELGDAMENGAVSARAFFDVFGEAVKGKFPVQGQVETAAAAFARFNNALMEIKATVANGGFLKALADGADELAKFMNSDAGQKLAKDLGGALKTAVDTLIAGFKILADNIDLVITVAKALIALKVAVWVGEFATSLGKLGVQLMLVTKWLKLNPMMALASAALAAAGAVMALSKSISTVTKAQLQHNASMKELKALQKELASTDKGDKEAIADVRSKIAAIKDLASEERKQLEQRIRLLKEAREYEEQQAKQIQAGGPLPGVGTQETFNRTTAGTESLEAEARIARAREQAARRSLMAGQPGFTGQPTGAGTRAGINDRPMAANLEAALTHVNELIKSQTKLADAFNVSAAAAAEIKQQLEDAEFIKREFEGKVSAEGLEELRKKYEELGEQKDRVAAGPILQEMRTAISDMNALAMAHNRGVDAANAEKVAQDARNRIVEAGIGITSRAANEIRGLAAAQADAEYAAQMQERRAEIRRDVNTERARTSALVNLTGNQRVEAGGTIDELQRLGRDPTDGRPFKQAGEALDTAKAAGKAAAEVEAEVLARETAELKAQIPLRGEITKLSETRTKAAAKQIGELEGMIALQEKYGNVTRESLKNLPKEAQDFVKVRGEEAAASFKPPKATTRRGPEDIFGERLRELQENIAAEKELASAHGQGAEAVEQMTRKQTILNQVHSLSEKLTAAQKAKLEELIGTLYDAKTASSFEGAKMDLKDEITQIQAMRDAHYDGAEAVNAEIVAQEARTEAIARGVYGDKEALKSLQDLMALRQRARQEEQVAADTRANRDAITSLHEEADALKLVGQERIRRLGQLQVEQDLRASGTPMDTKGAKDLVESGGNLAIETYTDSSKRSIESTERSIQATENQRGALSLLGEAYVRRSAELQKEAELLEANGSATDELSQKQIRLAGDSAVASDRFNRQNDALRDLADSGLTFNEQMRQISYDGLGSLEDALVDIITGTKSVKEAFRDMAKSMAADLARMAVRQAIIVPLAGLLSSAFMGPAAVGAAAAGGAATGMPVGLGAGAGIYHGGGVPGLDRQMIRPTDPIIFKHAPRYHTGKMPSKPGTMPSKVPGVGGGEVAAILRKDEGVFTPGQMKALGPAGGSQTVVVSPNINVTQPAGATQEQGNNFGKAISRQIEGMVDERIQRAFRPGGLRNQ